MFILELNIYLQTLVSLVTIKKKKKFPTRKMKIVVHLQVSTFYISPQTFVKKIILFWKRLTVTEIYLM